MPRDLKQDGLKDALDVLTEAEARYAACVVGCATGERTVQDLDRATTVLHEATRRLVKMWRPKGESPLSGRTAPILGDAFEKLMSLCDTLDQYRTKRP